MFFTFVSITTVVVAMLVIRTVTAALVATMPIIRVPVITGVTVVAFFLVAIAMRMRVVI